MIIWIINNVLTMAIQIFLKNSEGNIRSLSEKWL